MHALALVDASSRMGESAQVLKTATRHAFVDVCNMPDRRLQQVMLADMGGCNMPKSTTSQRLPA
eukprot:1161654-Pelagomonas_calceolata.AAC.16